jgi:HSP20 family protein
LVTGANAGIQIQTVKLKKNQPDCKDYRPVVNFSGSHAVAKSLGLHRKKGGIMSANIMKRKNGAYNVPSTFGGLVDQLFANSLDRFFADDPLPGAMDWSKQVPVNIRETDKTFELSLVAPGLKKEDFKLEVNGDVLTVSFEHREENSDENSYEGWLRKEYRQQSFSRSFNLTDAIDVNKIKATYQDGILMLSLTKKEGAQRISRRIEIN